MRAADMKGSPVSLVNSADPFLAPFNLYHDWQAVWHPNLKTEFNNF